MKMEQVTDRQRERIETANTIVRQMGGQGRLRAMIGARNFVIVDNGVQFDFAGYDKANRCIVRIDRGKDLYVMELWQIANSVHVEPQLVVSEDDLYFDQLKPMFEHLTGLYLTL